MRIIWTIEWIEVIWKSLLVFTLLIVLTRMIGKKLLSQMTFFDFVIGITIGTVAGAYITLAIQGKWVLLSPIVLTAATLILSKITFKNLKIRKIVEGEPVVIIQNGKILEKNMRKLRYNMDDLQMQLRNKGVFDPAIVEFAVLEPHGRLSILKKSQYSPLTPKDMNMDTNYKGLSTEIIKDGAVLEENLDQNNLDFKWLYQELKKNRVDDINQVVYAALKTDGSLYIDLEDDRLDYVQKVED